jgi:hypothetical protein
MITPAEARSGKGHRDENFPVASRLIHPRHRAPILAFYEFVRTADDIADHAGLAPQEKLALMARLEATLLGRSDDDPVGVALRSQLAARQLSPRWRSWAPSPPPLGCSTASAGSRAAPAISCATADHLPPGSRTRGSPWRWR